MPTLPGRKLPNGRFGPALPGGPNGRPFASRDKGMDMRVFACFAAMAASFVASVTIAQSLPPEIGNGAAWLTGQIQADGRLAGESASIALPLQAEAETAQTLSVLGTVPASVVARIDSTHDALTEYLARRVNVLAVAGQGATPPLADLMALRNADGGFGSGPGYSSDPLDTAFALHAMAQGGGDPNAASAALAYLVSSKHADGSWGIDDQGSVYVTAQVLVAAQAWSTRFAVAPISAAARDWLLAHRGANQQFTTSFDNAVALIALTTQTAQPDVLQPLADGLRAAQRVDGSWDSDPYVTALALRALWSVSHAPPQPTTGSIVGRIVDAANASPIAGATVQRTDDGAAATASIADGSFTLPALAPGNFSIRISKVGYGTREFNVQVSAGQTLQLGNVQLSRATLTADLSGIVRSNTGAALSGAIVSVGTASVLTGTDGSYVLSDLDAGAATIQATKSGYQNVVANVTFLAGQHYSFSPAMYPPNTTPPTTATLRGAVINGTTQQPIVGATLAIGSRTATSAANGRFEMTGLPAGAFAMSVGANGYQGVTASGTLANGINDIGNVPLAPLPATSTISGLISDAGNGAPIAAANVVVEGQAVTAVSGPDGRYTLAGISGTSITLQVTATGYLGSRFDVNLPQPGNGTLDLQLTASQPSGLVFDEVRVDKPVYGPSDKIELEIEVKNTTADAAEMIIDADVRDPSGNVVYVFKANAHGAGQFPPNLPLGFPAASTKEVELEWAAQRLAAGSYTVYARGSDASGRVLADGSTQFTVRSEPALRGGVTPNPPIAQAGTDVPVHISADLVNVGNEAVPAGDIELSIVLQNADTDSTTVPQASASSWSSGTPFSNPRGLVRDAQGNLFTVNASDRKVLRVDGQTRAVSVLATVPDAPSGIALDAAGNLWIASTNKRISTVSPAGALTSINAVRITSLTGIDLDAAGNLVLAGSFSGVENGVSLSEQRLVRRAPDGTESVLWRNGLSQPSAMVKDDAGNFVVSNYGDNTLAKVTPQGVVTPFATGLNRPYGITRDATGNFYVANSGNGTIALVSAAGQVSTYATGLQTPMDVRFGAGGTLFVANQGNDSIVAIAPGGSQSVFARGVANQPEGMKYDAAGNLYIANGDGSLRRKAPDGSVDTLATGLSAPRGVALAADGSVFVANRSDGTIAKVVGTDKTTFASGLANPYGVAVDAGGVVHVAENGANRIRSFDASGSALGQVETLLYSPTQMRVDAQGRVFVANSDFITVIENDVPRILIRNFAASAISVDPVGGGLLAIRSRDVYRIGLDGSSTRLATLAFTPYDAVVDAAGSIIIRDYSSKRLQKLDASGTPSVFAQLADYPSHLVADLAGNVFVRLNGGSLHRVTVDGSLSQIVYSLNEGFSVLGFGTDDKMLVWTTSNRVYSLDPATGVTTRLKDAVSGVSGVTRGADGRFMLSFSGSQEVDTYDTTGTWLSRLDGFINPTDLLWDGSALRFVDSGGRFYTMAPGAYPSKTGSFNVSYLAKAGAEVLGCSAANVLRWTGTGQATYASLSGATLRGVAGRADGSFAATDTAASRAVEFNAARQVSADYAGIVRPQGLAFDAQGRLHVANYGASTVARLDANGVATTVTTVGSPRYLDFDGDGNLWISRSGGVTRVTPAGVAATVGNALNFMGLTVDGSQVYVVDQSYSLLRRLDGADWLAFAAGLSNPASVLAGAGDVVYVANRNSNAVLAYSQGRLDTRAVNLTAIDSLALDADGSLYVGRDSGLLSRINADGSVDSMHVQYALGQGAIYGLASASPQKLYASAGTNALFEIAISQSTSPPAPGTVVRTVRVPSAAIASGEDYAHFDFGDWLPPYGGDFKLSVARAGVAEPAVNYVHVGPHATGELTAGLDVLAPGDQALPMCLNLAGADFTSISRVEVDQVRRLASISTPNGMAADRAGNVYYTNGANLYRTDVQGVTTTLLSGLATAFGLAADSNENLYFPNKSGAGGTYQLFRVDRTGTRSVMAELGVTRANGVAVNSHDEILVGSAGKLLKVRQDGTVSVAATGGLPDPRGIAIDGRDNVYVQNNSGYVSEIKPDGSVTDLYTSNDGVQDPYFEGDGYPNIAADCADNLYVASFGWTRMGIPANEEHKIAQIVARTGHAAVLFDTLNVNSIINDIDYLAFDRFGSRLMMYNDYEHMIWQVPVTCGAIGVDAHIVTAPGQTLASPTKAPAAVVEQADGRTEYVWSMRDVTADGENVCFDTTLHGLTLGEQRKSVDSGFINFRNSFSPDDVTLPLDVPLIHVGNLVQLGIATDQADYPANATAQVSTTLDNTNAMPVDGVLKVAIHDAHGAFVGNVLQQDVSIPALGQLPVDGVFPIGTILPGTYVARATLSDNGELLAQSEASFVVLADNAQALATTRVTTDKQVYQSSDHVQIASRATSLSANAILENLTLTVQVLDAAQTLLYTQGYPIDQLLPGAIRDFNSTQVLQNAPAGNYAVHQTLSDAAGHVLDTQDITYRVASSGDTGFGLVGTLAADPVEIPLGGTVQLSGSATNQGNTALAAVPLSLSLVDVDHGAVLWTWSMPTDIAVGATVAVAQPWAAGATPEGLYVAILKATVGGQEHVLAQTTVRIVAPVAQLDAHVDLSAHPTLQALALIDPMTSVVDQDRVRAALAAQGYGATFVASAADFSTGVRSGTYQLYLLLGAHTPIDATTERLLREAVHRGEGVLSANGGASLSDVLAEVTGLVSNPGLTSLAANRLTIEATAPGGPAQLALSPALAARQVSTTSASVLAEIEGRFPSVPSIGSLADAVAADSRVDIGYFGTDAGANGSHLGLASVGRLRNADGSDRATIWRVRNSGNTARSLTLASSDGTWSLPFVIAAHVDAFIASPVVTATAEHRLSEAATLIQATTAITGVFADARVVDRGENPGAVALWANSAGAGYGIEWSGSKHISHGAVHSNSGIRWNGAQNTVDGPVHYVTTFTNNGSQNTFSVTPRVVSPQPLPQLIDLDDYRPGGPVQAALGSSYLDQSGECAKKHRWQRNGSRIVLPPGVYWIPCDVQLAGSSFSGTVSLISTGSIQLSGSSATFQPFHEGIQFATSQAGSNAVQLSTSSLTLDGLVYAPNGAIEASGSNSLFKCSLVADTIRMAGAMITIDPRQCAYAAIERRSPAVVWNAFGSGYSGYTAFDALAALAQVEPGGSGPLSELFGGVLGRIGPVAVPLRTGSLVPIAVSVQNHGDIFQGTLQLATQGDAAIVLPGVPTWLLDFGQSGTFDATATLRLGSGTTTTLNATVAATTPIAVDPLTQATLSINHADGEDLAELVSALTAIGGRDAPLDAALADLQAAVAASAASDQAGVIGALLAATEEAGRSTHAQADAFRTRIDWVLWRESR